MLHVPHDLLGREVDLGEITVTAGMIAEYMRAVDDPAMSGAPPRVAPPTFCLAVRRAESPSVPLPADMFSVHGGHDLEFHQPIRAGERYAINGRVADVFEKMGRTGRLTVVVSEVRIADRRGYYWSQWWVVRFYAEPNHLCAQRSGQLHDSELQHRRRGIAHRLEREPIGAIVAVACWTAV